MLCNLDGEEFEVINDLELCPMDKSFSRVNKNLITPKIFKKDRYSLYFGEMNKDIEASERIDWEMKEEGTYEDVVLKNHEIIYKVNKSRFKIYFVWCW